MDEVWPPANYQEPSHSIPPVDWKKRHTMGTKNNPGNFDCYAKALDHEPMFTLLARDPTAPMVIRRWVSMRHDMIDKGLAPPTDINMCEEALQCAANMEKWRIEHEGEWRSAPLLAQLEDEATLPDGRRDNAGAVVGMPLLDIAASEALDKIGELYELRRKAAEPDSAFRERIRTKANPKSITETHKIGNISHSVKTQF